MKRYITF